MSKISLPVYGPLAADQGGVGASCPGCNKKIAIGDYVVLLAVGPGANEDARALARNGKSYKAIAVAVHLPCATGEIRVPPIAPSDRSQ